MAFATVCIGSDFCRVFICGIPKLIVSRASEITVCVGCLLCYEVFLISHSHSIFVLAGHEFFVKLRNQIHLLLLTKSLVFFLVLFSESPRLHDGQHLFLLFFFTIPITLLLFNYSVFDCQLAIRELLVVFVLANYHLDLPFQAVNLVFIIIFHLFQSLSCL